MSPRRRSREKRGWPHGLYERDGYYSWRSPVDGVEYGIGRDRAQAFAQATEANLHCCGLTGKERLIDRLTGNLDRSVEKWNEKYQGLLATAKLADNTRRTYKSLGLRMVRMLKPETPLANVRALAISAGLEAIARDEGKARTAQALRNFMRDSFREARVQGWYTAENPVFDTKLPMPVEVKRSRLSLEVYQRIHAATELTWLKNAMDLALVSGQRREDVANAQFRDFHDGSWWCVQASEKATNPHRLVIPLELRLNEAGLSLGDVVSRCRRTGVVSKHLIHQTVDRGNSPRGRRIWIDSLSKRFHETLVTLAIDWGEKGAPTFHEIRSLSERLYAAQGGIDTQELLGHNDPETTAMYHDSRGSEWVRIKI